MIWVAWRQQRLQILITVGLVVVLAAVLVYVRADAISLMPDLALISDKYDQFLIYLPMVVLALPALFGMFTGAPLFAREVEQGTHVFGLTQSVGRTRWWATKLAVAGLPITVAMFAFGLFASWALEPLNFVVSGRLNSPLFETQGVVVGAYTAATFAIGATVGLLARNTLAAMVITLAAYVLLMFTVANEVRPNYAAAESSVALTGEYSTPMGAWRIEYGYTTADGRQYDLSAAGGCRTHVDETACLQANGIVSRFTKYHPVERFWRFQFTEAGLFLVLGAAALGGGALAARRRLT